MYPEDPDFPLGATTLRLLKSTMPSFPIKHFYDASKGFEDQILSKNESFFLDHSFEEFKEEVNFGYIFKIFISLLRHIIANYPS